MKCSEERGVAVMDHGESAKNLTQGDVKSFLQVYTIGRERRQILEDRRQRLIGELRTALPGPLDAGSNLAKIEARLIAQRRDMAVLMLKVLDLVALLPLDSLERKIVEMRHIDGMDWKEITSALYLSRSYTMSRYSKALDMLLGHEEAREIVAVWKRDHTMKDGD